MSEKDIEPEDLSRGYSGEERITYAQKGENQISPHALPDNPIGTSQFEANHIAISTPLTEITMINGSSISLATKDQDSVNYPLFQRVLGENSLIDNTQMPAETHEETPKNQPPVEMTTTTRENGTSFGLGHNEENNKPLPNSISNPISADSQQHLESESNSLNTLNTVESPASDNSVNNEVKKVRNRWSTEETNALINGCFEHGVGAWKKILDDPKYSFVNRTSVDLKDRFRTLFPEEYHRLYHTSMQKLREVKKQPMESYPTPFRRVDRRPKRKFNQQDDENLKAGFQKYGCAWARIVKDPSLNLQDRRSTDLRDRFRTAFPEIYEQLGYAPKYPTKLPRSQPSEEPEASQEESVSHTSSSYAEASVFRDLESHAQSTAPLTPTQHGASSKGPLTPPPTKKRKKKNVPVRPEHEETVESVYGKVIDAQLKEGIESDVWVPSSANSDPYAATFNLASSNDQQDQYRKILPKQ